MGKSKFWDFSEAPLEVMVAFLGPLPSLTIRGTGETTNRDDIINISLVDIGVTEDLLDRIEDASEEILRQLLKTSASKEGVEANTLNLNGGGGGSFGVQETTEGAKVGREILVLALELELGCLSFRSRIWFSSSRRRSRSPARTS